MKHKETEKHLPNLSYSTNFSDFFFKLIQAYHSLFKQFPLK